MKRAWALLLSCGLIGCALTARVETRQPAPPVNPVVLTCLGAMGFPPQSQTHADITVALERWGHASLAALAVEAPEAYHFFRALTPAAQDAMLAEAFILSCDDIRTSRAATLRLQTY